jgi:cation diffusion facilitator family transporter
LEKITSADNRSLEDSTHQADDAARQKMRMRAIVLSFLVGVALMGIKFLTYRITHSSAVLSDALESIINVVASAFAALSIWMAAKPPDPEHPYGHGKIEYFSAGFEGALIIFAAIGIFYTGVKHLRQPHALPNIEEGIVILLGATVVNLLLGLFLVRRGRKTDSMALEADGKHILTDVYTSFGVIIGLILVFWTGWVRLDGIAACLIGINILATGGRLVYQSFSRLMDASDPELLDQIADLLERHRRPEWINIHELRAWWSGRIIHIDLHLVLPRHASLYNAHLEAKHLEKILTTEFCGNADVLIHTDPCIPVECPVCGKPYCDLREHRQRPGSHPWSRHHLTQTTTGQLDGSAGSSQES